MKPLSPNQSLRLRRHADFQRVYAATRKQHSKQLSYFAAARAGMPAQRFAPDAVPDGPRIGLTVGKVMGKAHTRNRIKRRLREALRAEAAHLHGLPLDVVLHPRGSVETLELPSLRAELRQVFATIAKQAARGALPGPRPAAPDRKRT